MHHLATGFICLFLLACAAGCGDSKGEVRGTVSFDDQPVKKGAITFVSTGEPLIREGAVIVDGSFTTRVPPGTYKIELNARRVTGTRTQKGFDGTDEVLELTEELFPERYNSKSELIEVIKAGENVVTLKLKSES
jgi:hypothetical protein